MRKLVVVLIILFVKSVHGQEVPVKFEIDNLRNADGSIIVSVYKDSESFDDGIPDFRQTFSKTENMKDGTFQAQILLLPGIYGLVFLDDENDDGEMTNNLLGLPKEGFGFSNYYLSGFKKPKFSDFSFELTEDGKSMKIKLRYL